MIPGLYHVMTRSSNPMNYQEDLYIAVKQLSQYAMGSQCVSVGDNYEFIDINSRNIVIKMDHHRLVKTPGFEILLNDIDDLSFHKDDELIFMSLKRHNKYYTFLIASNMELTHDEE